MIKESVAQEPVIKKEFPKELIEKRREFTNQVKSGNVSFKTDDGFKLVTCLKRGRIDYIKGEIVVVIKPIDIIKLIYIRFK